MFAGHLLMMIKLKKDNMKLLIGIIMGFLFSVALVNAELVVKGKKVIYTGNAIESGVTITEGMDVPENPKVNDLWRNISDNIVYIYDGNAWVVKNTTADIKNEIQIFKNNINNVDDPEAQKCLKALGKILLKLYKE